MSTETNKTPLPVIFRVWKGEPKTVVALFPSWAASRNGFDVMCYEHVGQHGSADYQGAIARSRPATEAEYRDLKHELEHLPDPHVLRVLKRRPPGMKATA